MPDETLGEAILFGKHKPDIDGPEGSDQFKVSSSHLLLEPI
jgi:hypothetical protein